MFKFKISPLVLLWIGACVLPATANSSLPPGSLNLTVDPIPDHLLGTSITYIDLPSEPNTSQGMSLPPGIPKGYIEQAHNTRHKKRADKIYRPNDSQYPYSTIGKVFVGHIDQSNTYIVDYKMSGVLVGNSSILLSSQYVTGPWSNSNKWFIRFVPVYESSSAPYGDSYVNTCVGNQPAGINGHDYIVCQLYTAVGATAGYLGYSYPGSLNDYFNPSYSSGGFPQNTIIGDYLGVQDNITVISYNAYNNDGVILKTLVFGSADGWIGGPLWDPNTLRVVAVLSGIKQDPTETQRMDWAGGSALVKYVQYSRDHWG